MTQKETIRRMTCLPLKLVGHTLLFVGLALAIADLGSHAQAAGPPITPSGLNTQVHLSAASPIGKVQYDITGGTRPGGGVNLFYSFEQFNVPTNNIANFLNDSGLPTSNILGRVTGQQNPSIIFGTIQTNGTGGFDNANLFLMNPYGFIFGPNATVNVGGMVAFTTADYLRLADGVRFNAIPNATADVLLTALPVAAFGFLGSNPAAIAVQGSMLTVQSGQSFSLVGGNQGFSYTNPDTGLPASVPNGVTMTGGKLSAPNGQINVASVAALGEVSAVDFMPSSGITRGNITFSQGAILDVTGNGGGSIRIRSGQFIMDHAAVVADTTSARDGAPTAISIDVASDLALNNQSSMVARSFGAGNSGQVEASASNIQITGGSQIITEGRNTGRVGDITLAAQGNITIAGTDSSGTPSAVKTIGPTGAITVTASNIAVNDLALIKSTPSTAGVAGDITLTSDNLTVTNGGGIVTSGAEFSSSGNIHITAKNSISLLGQFDLSNLSRIANENGGSGGTGNIVVETKDLMLSGGGRILSDTSFSLVPPQGPKISVAASGSVNIEHGSDILVRSFVSDVGALELSAKTLTMSDLGRISTLTFDIGNAGTLTVIADDIALSGGSQISSSSLVGAGNAGSVTVTANNRLSLTGQGIDEFGILAPSGIFTSTRADFADPSFTGAAGTIAVAAKSLEVSNGARIDSSSIGYALGNAGSIEVNAYHVQLNSGATITSNSTGAADAGGINIAATNGLSMQNSSITTQANHASGGIIKITTAPSGTVQLTNSTISASVLDGTGGGGSVNIDPQFVILQNSQILAQAVHGPGGNIFITSNLFLPDADSVVSASSQFGVSGTVTIQSPNAPASGKIQPLGNTLLEATSLLNQRCAALAGGEFSSFTVAGRDSLPTEPGSWLPSPLALGPVGFAVGTLTEEGERVRVIDPAHENIGLSLRQIAPAGFLTQAFAVDRSASCQS